jgi:hypothetical protein
MSFLEKVTGGRHARACRARRVQALLPQLFAVLFAFPAHAQFPGTDPDWPCAARLVPTLTAGAYWAGPITPNPAWRDDDKLFPLVTEVIDRDTPDAEAEAKLSAYAASIPAAGRGAVFSALVDQTNDERTLLIRRIKQLGLRQRRMGDAIARLSTQADQLPAADPRRAELGGERDLDVQAFGETQHTMTYACEAPAGMERRLGMLAKILQK